MGFGKSVLAAYLLSVPLVANGQQHTCLPWEEQTILDFENVNVRQNDLDVDDVGQMRLIDVGTFRQGDAVTYVDLVVKRIPGEPYDPFAIHRNGIDGYYGVVNIASQNGQGCFEFCFEYSDGTPFTAEHFFFSYYDLDAYNDLKGFEQVTLRNDQFMEYYLSASTELVLSDDGTRTTFTATKLGTGGDNPSDPNNLNQLQKDRGVVFLMGGLSCFEVKMSVECTDEICRKGRNFYFAGRSESLIPACPTQSPTAAPTNLPPPPPPTSGVIGDPHIKTWKGELFDFHGVCDLVMVQNPDFASGLGMDIHIRTKRTRNWSYISNAVVRIGKETLEIMGGSDGKYWINGVGGGELTALSGFAITHRVMSTHGMEFVIDLTGGEHISLKTFKDMIMVNVENASDRNFGSSVGLLGSFGKGEKKARDNLTIIEDDNEFGQEWQVKPGEDKLFHNIEGPQAPEKCDLPNTQSLRRRLGESNLTLDDAKTACSRVRPEDFDICVFDVLATDDSELAGAY